jgi:hypothetical protein
MPHLPAQDGEVVLFSARQFDRLNTFKNMVEKVLDSEKDERDTGKSAYLGTVVNGQVRDPYFRLDSRFRAIWNKQAAQLYETELMPDPGMKEAADDIVAELKLQYDGKPAMTPGELVTLFAR